MLDKRRKKRIRRFEADSAQVISLRNERYSVLINKSGVNIFFGNSCYHLFTINIPILVIL